MKWAHQYYHAYWNCIALFQGWRWAFYISALPGILLGILILATAKEPKRNARGGKGEMTRAAEGEGSEHESVKFQSNWCAKLLLIVKTIFTPASLLLCLSGSIRNGGMHLIFLYCLFLDICQSFLIFPWNYLFIWVHFLRAIPAITVWRWATFFLIRVGRVSALYFKWWVVVL